MAAPHEGGGGQYPYKGREGAKRSLTLNEILICVSRDAGYSPVTAPATRDARGQYFGCRLYNFTTNE